MSLFDAFKWASERETILGINKVRHEDNDGGNLKYEIDDLTEELVN